MQRTKTHLFTKADLHHSYGLLMAFQLICMGDSFYTIYYVGVRPLEHIPIIIKFQFEKILDPCDLFDSLECCITSL